MARKTKQIQLKYNICNVLIKQFIHVYIHFSIITLIFFEYLTLMGGSPYYTAFI